MVILINLSEPSDFEHFESISKEIWKKRNFQVILILQRMLQVKKHWKTILEGIKEEMGEIN